MFTNPVNRMPLLSRMPCQPMAQPPPDHLAEPAEEGDAALRAGGYERRLERAARDDVGSDRRDVREDEVQHERP